MYVVLQQKNLWYTAHEFMDLPVSILTGRDRLVDGGVVSGRVVSSNCVVSASAGPHPESMIAAGIEIEVLKEELRQTQAALAKAHNRCAELLIEKNAYLEERAELYRSGVPRAFVALDGEVFRTESEYVDEVWYAGSEPLENT